MSAYKSVNKQLYIFDKISCHILNFAAKFGCISDPLYIAMYYYNSLRYKEAASVLKMTKIRLEKPYLMYGILWNKESYIEALGGKSWSTKMKQAVAMDIILYNKICYINELIPEQRSARQNDKGILCIPVFVLIHFLEFLCYRHIDTTLSHTALDELQVLVQYGRMPYVPVKGKEISLQILGLCQQMTENP